MAEITKQALKVDNNQSFPNNNNGAITPSILRAFNVNMIDSMVDEIGYTADSSSWNSSISQLNAFSASAQSLTTGSLLITASAVSNVITFTKGNGTTFNVTVADTTDLGPLNTFTASAQISLNNLNQWTSSYQPVIVNLQASQSIDNTKFNNIGTQSGSWDNTSLNSYTASNDTKWNTLGALSGSFVTESETGSFARTDVSNTFTQTNIFTSISASSFVSASQFVGDGSKITGITASISLPILDEGIPQGNAVSMNFTGSGITATIVGGTAIISVNTADSGTINNLTASFNAYTSSTDAKFLAVQASTASLNQFTASFNSNTFVGTASFNAFTSSQETKDTTLASVTSSLNSATASLFTSASLALVTASFDNGTRNLTFTKGNTTQFSVNIPDVSGSSPTTIYEVVYTGENITKGDPLYISGSQGANPIVFIADAADPNKMPVTFISNETIGASNTTNAIVLGLIEGIDLTGYTAGQSIYVAEGGGWSTSLPSGSNSVTQLLGVVTKAGSGGKGLVLNPGPAQLPGLDTGKMWVGGSTNQPVEITSASFASSASFNSYTSSTDSRLNNIESTTASLNSSITNINSFTQSANQRIGSLEAATSSYVTSAITASSLVTASVNLNTITFTKGDASTFTLTVDTGSGGGTLPSGLLSSSVTNFIDYSASVDSRLNAAGGASQVQDEGTILGNATSFNFNGAGVTATLTAGTASITIPGGGGSIDTGSFLTTGSATTTQTGNGHYNFNVQTANDGVAIKLFNTGSDASGSMAFGITDPGSPFIQLKNRTWFQIQASDDLNYVNFTASFDNGLSVGPNFGSRTQMLTTSGSLALFNPNTQRAGVMTHLSANSTANNGVNLVFANNTNTGTTIISGSNNIFTNPATPTAGRVNYIGGASNLFLNGQSQQLPQITGSAAESGARPVMNANIINGTHAWTINQAPNPGAHTYSNNILAGAGTWTYNMTGNTGTVQTLNNMSLASTMTLNSPSRSVAEINAGASGSNSLTVQSNNIIGATFTYQGPVSSSTHTIQNNIFANGANPLLLQSSSRALLFAGNIINGNLQYTDNTVFAPTLGSTNSITNNNINGTLALNQRASSSLALSNNNINTWTISNDYDASSVTTTAQRVLAINGNVLFGITGNNLYASGSVGAVSVAKSFNNNLFGGSNISASIIANGTDGSMYNTIGVGSGLNVVGTNRRDASTTSGDLGKAGSAFFGRWNKEGAGFNTTAEVVLAVGTGTSGSAGITRKTGLLIDSGSNMFVEGTLNVSGSSSFTGSVYGNVVSMSVTSNTASMDLSLGNYFELTSSASPLRIELSNIKAGLTSTLIVSSSVSTSIAFSSNIGQPSPGAYSGSAASSIDILSFVAFNNSRANLVATKNIV